MKRIFLYCLSLVVFSFPLAADAPAAPVNLLSLQEGALPVAVPPCYGGWEADRLLDDSPTSGWACEKGRVGDNVFVFELVGESVLERFEFDNAAIDTEGSGAHEVLVEVSKVSAKTGFQTVLQATLAAKADNQRFAATTKAPTRWVRLTIRSNHGSGAWTELFSFRGFGPRPSPQAPGDISGTYETGYGPFHVRQQGTALAGCYEFSDGLLQGTIEGRVMKITWSEGPDHQKQGPAVMVFALDGQSFRGYWWHEGREKGAPNGQWNGEKKAKEVGGCPHWAGSVGGELKKQLTASRRARLYGILFDLDKAVIRPESKPVLDEVLQLLRAEPGWKLTIEGHTDASGLDAHNQALSEQRAAAVKTYLTGAGIDGARLKTAGFGESRPVADNATELGRAQNRRVELVRE
jgi:outer membrane protein OmpA-like peptidoglycan-associated protein